MLLFFLRFFLKSLVCAVSRQNVKLLVSEWLIVVPGKDEEATAVSEGHYYYRHIENL
jgi:hypothetical protein